MKLFQKKPLLLGLGISGRVYLYESENSVYVVKEYHSREKYESRSEYKERILHEYRILRQIEHPGFVKALKHKLSLGGNTIKVQLEAGHKDLRYLLKQRKTLLAVDEAFCLWKQICLGIRYLHELGYSHRDLKLENVVLSRRSNTIKIIDLATASSIEKPAIGLVGSLHYMAPEQVTKLSYDGACSDMWSLGIILYCLLLMNFPWNTAQLSDTVYAKYLGMNRDGQRETLKDMMEILDSLEAQLFVQELLAINPEQRLTISKLSEDPAFVSIRHCNETEACNVAHSIRG
ncbi:hypothetical protein PUMCH_001418 [Australozyma saopauloensis]|uniref:Protein kinase domain-containing protein n=1 Tax=Australozyma saopauloensis TaxID=291208 RepID=A0AAX4H7E5_9ASCO|nr:hypothetical protein PUMCH_001418 [[Candida] saopauloensis]